MEKQMQQQQHLERAPNGALFVFGEPRDIRLAVIHEALDQLTKRNLPTLSARVALLSLADELAGVRDDAPVRAD
jgi:hypothetical protein